VSEVKEYKKEEFFSFTVSRMLKYVFATFNGLFPPPSPHFSRSQFLSTNSSYNNITKVLDQKKGAP
jgi:hypothetical protein